MLINGTNKSHMFVQRIMNMLNEVSQIYKSLNQDQNERHILTFWNFIKEIEKWWLPSNDETQADRDSVRLKKSLFG